ncbi:hypothetical protein DXG01_004317 [Tephrocybe rancida]|nr:hypothetical protein DXG01_004317 [Tephrocybe rancida]
MQANIPAVAVAPSTALEQADIPAVAVVPTAPSPLPHLNQALRCVGPAGMDRQAEDIWFTIPCLVFSMKLCILKKHLKRGWPPSPSYMPIAGPPHTRADNLATGKLPSLIFVMHGQTLVQNQYLPCIRKRAQLDDKNPFLDDRDVHTVDPPLLRHCQKREAQWARWQTPREPTLVVDIKVLDFVSSLFLNVAPNNTGWTKTVETFLEKQGYKLKTKGSLQKRFRNTLVWYNVLQDATTRHVEDILRVTHSITVDLDDGKQHNSVNKEFDKPDPFSSPCARAQHPSPTTPNNTLPRSSQNIRHATVEDEESDSDGDTLLQLPQNTCHAMEVESDSDEIVPIGSKRRRDEWEVDEAEQNPFADPPARVRPSDYLRSQCPLCFGGEFPRESAGDDPDVIICLDACFTQKRNRQARDPPCMHPHTVFLLEQDLDAMERYMDALRAHKLPPKRAKITQEDQEDHIKGGLHVPNSVLDGCKSGFTAADERCVKASTQFFDDTALMALLCRHDIVLFLANMHSAGEKQHYVMALVETLFQHLPLEFCLSILYDIGCQAKCSCVKWGFLNRY